MLRHAFAQRDKKRFAPARVTWFAKLIQHRSCVLLILRQPAVTGFRSSASPGERLWQSRGENETHGFFNPELAAGHATFLQSLRHARSRTRLPATCAHHGSHHRERLRSARGHALLQTRDTHKTPHLWRRTSANRRSPPWRMPVKYLSDVPSISTTPVSPFSPIGARARSGVLAISSRVIGGGFVLPQRAARQGRQQQADFSSTVAPNASRGRATAETPAATLPVSKIAAARS